jgi:RHS repeat-associated protein
MTYDAVGNQTSLTKPGANTTTTSYDELNRPTLVTRDDGSTLRFGYDANGNRTSLKDGLNHETTFAYDALDREISSTDPADRTTHYTYDASSRQKTITDAAGRTTTLTYDDAAQLQQIDYSDAQTPSVDFDYDSLGRREAMSDGSGTSTYTYDSLGRLKSRTYGSNRTIAYAYDLANRLTKTTYPAGLVNDTLPTGTSISEPAVTRSYDDAGRVISITDWLQHETHFEYDANDNLREQRYPNATTAAFDYDPADRLTRRTDTGPANSEILDLGYTRKLNGQMHTQNRTGQTPPQTDTLSYDDLDQLTGATLAADNDAYAYEHDIADRLTQITTPDSSTTLEYDAANQLVRTRDADTDQELIAFSYDDVGNRTAQDPAGTVAATTYDYDQAGRLTHYQAPAADPNDPDVERNYAYDADGLRSDLLWDASSDLPLILGDSAGLYISGPDGLPLTQLTFDGEQHYYHHDQLGSTRAITNAVGSISARYSFDPYGNTTQSSGTTNNRFGYAGQHTDPISGLIYMRARWYDPPTGQFITSDPIRFASGETNLYRYAGGDPANRVDPSGLLSLQDFVDFSAGVGDHILLGYGDDLRSVLGIADKVDVCSGAYERGGIAGYGTDLVGATGIIRGGVHLAAGAARGAVQAGAGAARSLRFVTTSRGTTFDIPKGWGAREADNGKGIVYQRPGAAGNADSIRIMEPTAKYPNGYFRYYNEHGQPLTAAGKPGPQSATHHPEDLQGPLAGWPR